MQDFWFYIKLGFNHVMDWGAYDHILFLVALALPFGVKDWKKVVVLVTVFTITHCLSLGLSVYDLLRVDVGLIEFLIPLTILLTALFNIVSSRTSSVFLGFYLHVLATAFFGLIHGFGFSNYFNILMADEEQRLIPLLGFATGIELSQILLIFAVLAVAHAIYLLLKPKKHQFVLLASLIIIVITIPLLIKTFP